MNIEKKTITVEEAGRMLGVARPKAYELARKGIIPVMKLGPHKWVVPLPAMERVLLNAGNNGG